MNLNQPPSTDPAQLLRYRDRQYAADLLCVAISHLDLFTWLKENPDASTKTIAQHYDLKPRPLDVLLTLCRANSLIQSQDDHHRITAMAEEHLVKGSPWYLGPYYAPIQDSPITKDYLTVLRTGKPANWQAKTDGGDWHESMMDEGFAKGFTDLMNCRGMAFGQAMATALTDQVKDRSRVLDVGGGSGIYTATLLAAHQHLSGIVFEQPPVDVLARKEIEHHGLSDRIEVVSGDMFKDPWPDCDILLLSNVLHDWDFPEVRMLLERAADTLPPGGLLIIHEAFLEDDKTGPLPVAEYSALLMSITQGKCYTLAEYGDILGELDFEVGPYQNTIADRGFMTATKGLL